MQVSSQLTKILDLSFKNAKQSHHEFLTPEHVLRTALNFPQIADLLQSCGGDIDNIRSILNDYIETQIPIKKNENLFKLSEDLKSKIDFETANDSVESTEEDIENLENELKKIVSDLLEPSENPIETHSYQEIMKRAVMHCMTSEKKVIDFTDVLVSMYDEENNYCSYSLKVGGIARLNLLQAIGETDSFKTHTKSKAKEIDFDDFDLVEFDEDDFDLDDDVEDFPEDIEFEPTPNSRRSTLERYTTNLTKLAKENNLEPIVGREDELNRTIQILCRKTKNNPLLVGDSGVGKTVLANGLAIRIVNGRVPENLENSEIYSLNMTALIAGAKFRGDCEERFSKIVTDLSKKKNSILFIDEIHTFNSGGPTSGGGADISNILKPLFSNDSIHCIGTTTFDGFKKVFEKDRTLLRYFQKVDVLEPTKVEAVKILKGLKPHYEKYHHVRYSEKALQAAVDLSVQYLPDRRLPDKAIDIIDEAGAYTRIFRNGGFNGDGKKSSNFAQVSLNEIKKVASKMARVPLETVVGDEMEKIRLLETNLKNQIFGQDKAIEILTKAVKKARAGFRNPERPEGNFLFVGPTGVGKTELARCLSKNLNLNLIRFDMSEYQEKHTVSRLIGAPPGYVGFEDGGLLTDAVRKDPNSIVLLDEIEKAHSDIYNVLLQVMDYGFLTDNQGRQADFRNCIIIMTSNAGARDVEKGSIGFGDTSSGDAEQTLKEAVDKTFSPEFRNRLDSVVPFAHLGKEIVISIVQKEVEKLSERLKSKRIKLQLTPECAEYLGDLGYSKEFGARNIARTVDEKIAEPLADEVLFGKLSNGGTVTAKLEKSSENSKVVFEFRK